MAVTACHFLGLTVRMFVLGFAQGFFAPVSFLKQQMHFESRNASCFGYAQKLASAKVFAFCEISTHRAFLKNIVLIVKITRFFFAQGYSIARKKVVY
jgi:hypothetical protein